MPIRWLRFSLSLFEFFPAPIALGRYVRCGTLFLDQVTDAVGIIGLVRQHDGARAEVVEQRVGDLPCAWPAVKPSRIGSPCASTMTWIFVVSPPRLRPRQ